MHTLQVLLKVQVANIKKKINMKKEKNITINSNAAGYLKSLLAPGIKITDMYVKGKYLWAELSSGVRFGVKNQTFD